MQNTQQSAQQSAQQAAERASDLLQDLGAIDYLSIVAILLVALVAVQLVQWILPKVAERLPGRLRLLLLPAVPVLRVVIVVAALANIVPLVVNLNQENLLAIAGATGLAIGFAFKDYGSSIVAGIVNLYERACRPGDWIKVGDAYGEVKSLGLRAIKIVTPDDTTVSIPNLKIWTENVFNENDGQPTHLCVADFHLHPEHDAAWVRRKLLDVAYASPYLRLDRPVAVIAAEKPWGTHYRLKAYPIDGRAQFQFTTDLTIRGKQSLLARGIQLVTAPGAAAP